MKATGIIRRIDAHGCINIPAALSNIMQLREGTGIEFFTDGNTIILKNYFEPEECVFCCDDTLDTLLATPVCPACRNRIKELCSDGCI